MMFAFKPVAISPANAGTLGVTTRYCYALELGVRASGIRLFVDALIDTGADDVIIPHRLAPPGLDLTGAPEVSHTVGNGGKLRVQFAEVELTLFHLPHALRAVAETGRVRGHSARVVRLPRRVGVLHVHQRHDQHAV